MLIICAKGESDVSSIKDKELKTVKRGGGGESLFSLLLCDLASSEVVIAINIEL